MHETSTAGESWQRARSLLVGVTFGFVAVSTFGQDASTNAPAETNAQAAQAAPTSATAPLGRDYQAFQLVNDRNIFNPNRTRRSRYNEEEKEKPREPKIEVVALTGTLSYPKGTFAFFNSTATEFRKAVKVGDEIAGYTLKGIEQSQVALEHESQLLQLKVGQQLRRQDEGPWEVTTDATIPGSSGTTGRSGSASSSGRSTRRESSPETTTAQTGSTSNATNSPGEGPSDALKRLLEQRRKEQSK